MTKAWVRRPSRARNAAASSVAPRSSRRCASKSSTCAATSGFAPGTSPRRTAASSAAAAADPPKAPPGSATTTATTHVTSAIAALRVTMGHASIAGKSDVGRARRSSALIEVPADRLPEREPRPVQSGLHGRDGDLQNLRGLLGRQSLDVPDQENGSIDLGKLVDGGLDVAA